METSIPGVFIVKAPGNKKKPAILYLEISPVNKEGKIQKRKGLYLNTKQFLDDYTRAITNEKVAQLIEIIEKLNPKLIPDSLKKLEEIE